MPHSHSQVKRVSFHANGGIHNEKELPKAREEYKVHMEALRKKRERGEKRGR